jgi:hypothetical protein
LRPSSKPPGSHEPAPSDEVAKTGIPPKIDFSVGADPTSTPALAHHRDGGHVDIPCPHGGHLLQALRRTRSRGSLTPVPPPHPSTREGRHRCGPIGLGTPGSGFLYAHGLTLPSVFLSRKQTAMNQRRLANDSRTGLRSSTRPCALSKPRTEGPVTLARAGVIQKDGSAKLRFIALRLL